MDSSSQRGPGVRVCLWKRHMGSSPELPLCHGLQAAGRPEGHGQIFRLTPQCMARAPRQGAGGQTYATQEPQT